MTELERYINIHGDKYTINFLKKAIDEEENEYIMYNVATQLIEEQNISSSYTIDINSFRYLDLKETEIYYLLKVIYLKKEYSLASLYSILIYISDKNDDWCGKHRFYYDEIMRFLEIYKIDIDILEKYNYLVYISSFKSYLDKSIILCMILCVHLLNVYNKNNNTLKHQKKPLILTTALHYPHFNFVSNNYICFKFLYLIKHNNLPPELINLIYESYLSLYFF